MGVLNFSHTDTPWIGVLNFALLFGSLLYLLHLHFLFTGGYHNTPAPMNINNTPTIPKATFKAYFRSSFVNAFIIFNMLIVSISTTHNFPNSGVLVLVESVFYKTPLCDTSAYVIMLCQSRGLSRVLVC